MEKIESVQFNQNHGLFSVCLQSGGVRLFNVDPLAEKAYIKKDVVGTVKCCSLLYRTNLIALVAGGTTPCFADNTVLIYDDHQKEFVLEFTFPEPVLSVALQKNRLLAVLRHSIHIFSFPHNPRKLLSYETRDNPRGIGVICKDLLLFPGMRKGGVQTVDLSQTEDDVSPSPTFIQAHQNEIYCIAVDPSASYVATASAQGTLIRVFELASKSQVVELRRGSDTAILYCLNFSPDSNYLCCSSDKGTVHIFALKDTKLNRRSKFSRIGLSLGQYVESQWALANFTVPPECACICAFVNKNTVAAVCVDGTFHRYVFTEAGNCNRESFDRILDICVDDEF